MKRFKVTSSTQFAVLGMGKFGRSIVQSLFDNGYNVLACDSDGDIVHECSDCATHIVQAEADDKQVLERLGLRNFDVAVIAFSQDFEAAAVTATILKELGVGYIIAKANGPRQKHILTSIGVDRVILPEKEMGERLAYSLITNDLMDSIHRSESYDIIEMKPLPQWVGVALQKLKLRQTEGINIIAIIRNSEVMAVLDAQTKLHKDDDLIVLKSRLKRNEP